MHSSAANPSVFANRPTATSRACAVSGLCWWERLILAIGIIEIPLQLDKYFMYYDRDAKLGAVGGLNVSMTTLALVILYISWFFSTTASQSRSKPVVGRTVFGLPMLAYLAAVLLSALSAQVWMLSVFDLFLLTQAYLLFFYIANRIRTRTDILICLGAAATTLTIQAGLIFILKALHVDDQRIDIGPLVLTVWAGERHGGSMHSPVLAGSTMALIWLPTAATLLTQVQRKYWKWIWTGFFVATVTGMLAILLTQTRGALITTVAGSGLIGLCALVRGWLPKWTIMATALMAVLSIYPLMIIYEKRIQHGDDGSAVARKHLSLIAMEMIEDQPLFGFGAGNCHLAAQNYADQGKWRSEWYYTIHSKYLLVWVETGLIGLIAFLSVLVTGIYQGVVAWRFRDPVLSLIGLSLSAALVGHSLHLAVDIFNSRTQVQMLWFILGMLTAVRIVAESEYHSALRAKLSTRRKLSRSTRLNRARSAASSVFGGAA